MRPSRISLLIVLATSLLASILLSACGSDTPASTPIPSTTAAAQTNKIAVVLPGATNDAGWNSLGFEGVVRLRTELGGTVDFAENVTPDKEVPVMRDFATKGYKLIIILGVQYTDSIKKVAAEFPATWFVQINGFSSGPNFASVAFKYEEASYLAGVAAGMTSKSDNFGVILGPKYPSEVALEAGYSQGVKSVKPSATINVTHMPGWDDIQGAATIATDMFGKGAEVVFQDISSNDQVMTKLAQTQNKQLVNVLFYDMNYLSPDPNLVNILFSVSAPFTSVAKLWKDNKLEAKVYQVGIKDQALLFSPFRGKLSKASQEQFEKVRADIIAGNLKITVPSNP
jgi:basic membrane protein A